MAGALAGILKDCKECQRLRSPENFAQGTQVWIKEVQEDACEECEVMKAQPMVENELAVDLYRSLPRNYDGMSGLQIVTSSDIRFVFRLYDVPEIFWEENYNKILFLWDKIRDIVIKKREAKKK